MRRLGPALFGFLALACGGEVEPDSVQLDGYVMLDDAAREAGWHVRVGGSCFVWSGAEPVAVPDEEWVLVGRMDGEAYEARFLHPLPGELLSVTGPDLGIESVLLLEPIVPLEVSEELTEE